MLSGTQWAVLEPPVEACRPKAKIPPQDLQHTLAAILCRHQNGAKWRAIPDEFRPWQIFRGYKKARRRTVDQSKPSVRYRASN